MVGAEAASPQPTVPSLASIRTRMFCAAVMVSPAIFIAAFSGSATGMASTRRMVSGASLADGKRGASGFLKHGAL